MSKIIPGQMCSSGMALCKIAGTSSRLCIYCEREELKGKLMDAQRGCRGALAAADELMTEFVSKKRAANWQIINDGLVAARQGLEP